MDKYLKLLALNLFLGNSMLVNGQVGVGTNEFNRSPVFSIQSNLLDSVARERKWVVHRYVGINTGFLFCNGRTASISGMVAGVQLSRRLNDHWYAFAGISAFPSWVQFNGQVPPVYMSKAPYNNGFGRANGFSINPSAQLGLMYINEKKTFSISGSIFIEQYNPMLPVNNRGAIVPLMSNSQGFRNY